jgi:hypothetical protein
LGWSPTQQLAVNKPNLALAGDSSGQLTFSSAFTRRLVTFKASSNVTKEVCVRMNVQQDAIRRQPASADHLQRRQLDERFQQMRELVLASFYSFATAT